MSDVTKSDHITIIVNLPCSIGKVSRLLELLVEEWPGATVDVSNPGGWRIVLDPEPPT